MSGNQRTEELNNRIYVRNIPSSILQSQFSARPVSTKYAMMPILDRRAIATEPILQRPNYEVGHTFNPGNAEGPWSGYATHVNDESRLRNQYYALQKSDQAYYVPPSTSDMYNSDVTMGEPLQQPFPGLFEAPVMAAFNPNPNDKQIGVMFFDNCTRQQLKG